MNNNIKILSLIPYKVFPPNMGGQRGIALFYRALCNYLPITIFTINENISQENFEIINSISSSKFRYVNPILFFTIKKIAEEKKITHIIFEHPYYAWMLFLIKKFTKFKTIVHSHNIESERFKSIGKWWWKLLWHYEKWAYQTADIVWFISETDKKYAIDYYKIKENKSSVITYGTELEKLPDRIDLENSKRLVCEKHFINYDEKILLFNGALGYKPNLDAVKSIIEKINPILLNSNFKYKIIICGKGLPLEMNELKDFKNQNIIYAGFVDDIDLYFKASDIFINPVIDGGGIKTKLVEALGFGKNCVSNLNGSIGVQESDCDGRLKIIEDNNWQNFAAEIINFKNVENSNENFYKKFSWKYIAQKAVESLH